MELTPKARPADAEERHDCPTFRHRRSTCRTRGGKDSSENYHTAPFLSSCRAEEEMEGWCLADPRPRPAVEDRRIPAGDRGPWRRKAARPIRDGYARCSTAQEGNRQPDRGPGGRAGATSLLREDSDPIQGPPRAGGALHACPRTSRGPPRSQTVILTVHEPSGWLRNAAELMTGTPSIQGRRHQIESKGPLTGHLRTVDGMGAMLFRRAGRRRSLDRATSARKLEGHTSAAGGQGTTAGGPKVIDDEHAHLRHRPQEQGHPLSPRSPGKMVIKAEERRQDPIRRSLYRAPREAEDQRGVGGYGTRVRVTTLPAGGH